MLVKKHLYYASVFALTIYVQDLCKIPYIVSHGNARNPIHLTAMSELYHVVGYDLYCIYQNDVRWPCSTKSSSGFLNVWLRLSDKLDIFVCLRKSSNSTCASVESILSLLNSLNKRGKISLSKAWGKLWADTWCGLVERSRKAWEGGKLRFVFIMAGHDPEKFDGMFLAMCQRSEKGIEEVVIILWKWKRKCFKIYFWKWK